MVRIIADDFGLHKKVNEGISSLLKGKKISGTSVMANGSAFDDAVLKPQSLKDSNIGIHLVLVNEKALSESFVLPESYKDFLFKYLFGLITLNEIEKECRAQLEIIKNAGIKPSFINSHQHLHLLPGIMNIAVKLAKEYDISYVRTLKEPLSPANPLRIVQLCFLRFLSTMARVKIKKNNLKTNDFFVGFLHAGNLGETDIKKARELSEKYQDKLIELNCHPGYEDSDLRDRYKSWGGYNWQKELNLLKNFN